MWNKEINKRSKLNKMQAINIEVILTLIIGLIVGYKFSTLKLVFSKSIALINLLPTIQKNNEVSQSRIVNFKKGNRYFDDLEIRLLKSIVDQEEAALGITHLNSILNLAKLSEENQRQRRHLFLKELNLKLFLIFSVREGVSRIESDSDKRIKMYVLNEKIDSEAIKEALKA